MADEPNEMELAQALPAIDGIRGRNKKQMARDLEGGGGVDRDFAADDDDDAKRLLGIAAASGDGAHVSHVQTVRNWWTMMRVHFGDSLLLQIFFVYFTQGIRSTLCSLGTSYYLNETLALPPAQAEALRGTAAIPWIIKPVYGMLSDSVPIWGTRRKSYLFIFSAVSAAAYIALSIPGFITTYHGALVALVTASLGIAFCDVVIDGKVVEAARSERDDMAGNLQTLSWISLSVGSVLGSMVSGYALTALGPQGVFFLSALGPLCVVGVSATMHEEPFRRPSSGAGGASGLLHTVASQCRALARVVVDPVCWRPMLWIFLSNALPPSLGEALFSFKTAELGFSKAFLGFISTVGSLTLLGTTALYNASCRDLPFRQLFLRVQLASAVVSFSELLLVARVNVALGINDRFFIFGDEILSDVVARLKHMPSLVLCAKLCPPGVEGTMFALLMSIYNFSWSLASYGGATLCAQLAISKTTGFTGLATAVTVRSVAKLLPLLLLFMVPASTSIHSAALAPNNATVATTASKTVSSAAAAKSKRDDDGDDIIVQDAVTVQVQS